MEVRPLTPRIRALTWRWAPRLGALAILVTANATFPSRPAAAPDGFAYWLIVAILISATVTAMLYVRNRRLVVSDSEVRVFDLFGLRRAVRRSELSELVGLRLRPSGDSLPALPIACFRGRRGTRLHLVGPLWSPDELEAAAETLGLEVRNETQPVSPAPAVDGAFEA